MDSIQRALNFLVVSCPCALVISVPLSFFGGIGGASKNGILVKGGNYLEVLAKTELVVFDKTGTLTRGVFNVTAIHPDHCGEAQLLELAAWRRATPTTPSPALSRRPTARNWMPPGYPMWRSCPAGACGPQWTAARSAPATTS